MGCNESVGYTCEVIVLDVQEQNLYSLFLVPLENGVKRSNEMNFRMETSEDYPITIYQYQKIQKLSLG